MTILTEAKPATPEFSDRFSRCRSCGLCLRSGEYCRGCAAAGYGPGQGRALIENSACDFLTMCDTHRASWELDDQELESWYETLEEESLEELEAARQSEFEANARMGLY